MRDLSKRMRTESRRLPSVGRCIYCPGTERLSDEHILPDGMGGRVVLPDASCEECRKMTCKFEQHVLRGMLWPLRVAMGVRGTKRRIPNKIQSYVPNVEDDGATLQTRSPDDVAAKAVFPVFSHGPGMLEGRPRDAPCDADFVLIMDPKAIERAEERGEHGVTIFAHEKSFMRMLAKIAYAHAVSSYGVDGFEPFLLDIIAGRANDYPFFIGGDIELGSDNERGEDEREIWLALSFNPFTGLILVKMRFFASQGAPIYTVVTGRRQVTPFGLGMSELPQMQGGNIPSRSSNSN